MDVVIGTPVYRQGAHIIEKFLANQQQIQHNYPSSELVFATSEHDFVDELQHFLVSWKLRGTVVSYEVEKPSYASSKIWNIVGGREAIRNYVLTQTDAGYLLFLDSDMVIDASVINIMERKIQNYDAVFSGYPLRTYGIGLAGCGCVMLARSILERLRFRCYEFRNGEIIFEDNMLEMDLFRSGGRIKKGFFVPITHYVNPTEGKHIEPQRLGLWRRIANNSFIRYMLIKTSISVHYNIPWHLKVLLSGLTTSGKARKS
ncbi:MAG: glycosyltransferase family 2 protein [Chloroflexi bacterium]|nr:glycosyltransferase family 2 protein [Chloroflexota bacterium]